jgi:hypothetical protein
MQVLLDKKEDAHDEEVERTLGTSVAALYSVPTAIFCFLRACTPIPEIDVCKLLYKNYPLYGLFCIIYKEKYDYEITMFMCLPTPTSNFRNNQQISMKFGRNIVCCRGRVILVL